MTNRQAHPIPKISKHKEEQAGRGSYRTTAATIPFFFPISKRGKKEGKTNFVGRESFSSSDADPRSSSPKILGPAGQ